jgi:1,4-dihydroxy-2-naphthoate octaprenyltransferase
MTSAASNPVIPLQALPWPSRAGRLWQMTRPGFLIITPVACAIGLASGSVGGFDGWLAFVTVLLATVAHAAANVLNDYEDAVNGADAANRGAIAPFTGGAGFIQRGEANASQTRALAGLLALVLAAAGLALAARVGAGLLVIGLAGMALGWAYSSPPLKLMSRGLGELAVALSWWLIVIGADYVQRRSFSWQPVALGLPYALLVANILFDNCFPDAAGDAAVGKRTLAVRLGLSRAAWLYAALALWAYVWVVAGVAWEVLPRGALWSLLGAPFSLAAAVLVLRRATTPQRLKPALVLTIVACVVHGVALAAGLAV